jgi:hypothetical protein
MATMLVESPDLLGGLATRRSEQPPYVLAVVDFHLSVTSHANNKVVGPAGVGSG